MLKRKFLLFLWRSFRLLGKGLDSVTFKPFVILYTLEGLDLYRGTGAI